MNNSPTTCTIPGDLAERMHLALSDLVAACSSSPDFARQVSGSEHMTLLAAESVLAELATVPRFVPLSEAERNDLIGRGFLTGNIYRMAEARACTPLARLIGYVEERPPHLTQLVLRVQPVAVANFGYFDVGDPLDVTKQFLIQRIK